MHNLNISPFCGCLLEMYFKPTVPAVVDLSPLSLPLLTVSVFDSIFSFSPKHWGGGRGKENWILKALLMTELL